MPTYLYCVASDRLSVAPLAGVDGAAVRMLSAAGLVAWVSDVDAAPVKATVERLKAHDAVCGAAMATGTTPLPVRFGQTFADDATVIAAIGKRRPVLSERLTRLAGCVELRVVVRRGPNAEIAFVPIDGIPSEANDPPDPPDLGKGTAFLRRLAREARDDTARDAACEELRSSVIRTANGLIVERRRCEASRGLSFFPLLVRRSDVEASRVVIAGTAATTGLDATVLGPFPPYSFTGDA